MAYTEKYPICSISRLRMGTDGDGIRTLIVMESCPLRCRYCINPFTWDGSRKNERMSAEEIYERVRIDRPYMLATCGGLTFGGGEPLLYPQLLREMRELCDPDMTIYVETSLNVPTENLVAAAEQTDVLIVDVKAMDAAVYQAYTGKDNALVLENLKILMEKKGSNAIIARIPLIPQFTDQKSQQRDKEILEKLGIRRFDLFSYVAPNPSKD